jgi:hypothetical protein
MARPYFRRLVTSFLPARPGFDSMLSHVGLVVDKMTLGQVLSVLRFGLPVLIPPTAPH